MKYSRFDEHLGLYEVYEDRRTHPMNGDLPVPDLPAPDNRIGVSARQAGRRLPRDARRVGTSFHPVGVVIAAVPSGAAGLGTLGDQVQKHPWAFGAGAAILTFGLFRAYVSSMQQWGRR